jgi:hypothetical protein
VRSSSPLSTNYGVVSRKPSRLGYMKRTEHSRDGVDFG